MYVCIYLYTQIDKIKVNSFIVLMSNCVIR